MIQQVPACFQIHGKCSLLYCQRHWEIYIEEMVLEKKVQAGDFGLLGMVPPIGEKHVKEGSDTKEVSHAWRELAYNTVMFPAVFVSHLLEL